MRIRKVMRLSAMIIPLTLLLSSCTTIKRLQPVDSIALGHSSYLSLSNTPQAMIGQGFLAQITGQTRQTDQQNSYELLVQVELNQDNIVMVGTTANGMILFELLWQKNQPYTLKRSPLAKDIQVQYLLADFQLVHWPSNILQNQLHGAQLSPTPSKRSLVDNLQQPLITIDYDINSDQNKQIRYNNHQRHYGFTLTILENWTL